MGAKLKVSGWIALGIVAGALTTIQLQAIARGSVAQLPLEELQQLAAVFGMVKSDYVEPVDEKKLINDAIAGMAEGGHARVLPAAEQCRHDAGRGQLRASPKTNATFATQFDSTASTAFSYTAAVSYASRESG